MSWRARFSPVVGNITIYLNPKDPNCFGVRSFLRNNLAELRVLNPETSFNVQELSFGEPNLFVGYNFNDQRNVRLAGATEEEAEDIFASIALYGDSHAVPERFKNDNANDGNRVINFGFAESFNIKNDGLPFFDVNQTQVDAVDDPGQAGRVLSRNNFFKLTH